MYRRGILLVVLFALSLGMATTVAAEEGHVWPHYQVDDYYRGPGHYFSWVKLALIYLIFLAWVKSTDWIHQDAHRVRQRPQLWVSLVVGSFAAALVGFWLLTWFGTGMSLLVLAYAAPAVAYVLVRNRHVEEEDRVFTPDHLREWFHERLVAWGLSQRREKKRRERPSVVFQARCGANQAANEAISRGARTMAGYATTAALFGDLIAQRGEAVMMDLETDTVPVRYLVDGLWHEVPARTPGEVIPIVEMVQALTTGDPTGQKAAARGNFDLDMKGRSYVVQLTQQNKGGVRHVILKLDDPETRFNTLEDLGMHPKMAEQVRERLAEPGHFVLISGLPGGGLSATMDVVTLSIDRIRRDCAVFEPDDRFEREIDTTSVHRYVSERSPAELVAEVIRTWPDVLVMRELKDGQTARLVCKQAREERLVVGAIAAKSAAEALLRVLMLKVPANEFAEVVSLVLHQRLIRRLCEECKQAYEPGAELIQQLGLPPERVKTLFRPPESPSKVCTRCGGTGYYGRVALFEMLVVDDAVRELLTTKPSLDGLHLLARQKKMHRIRDFGAVMIARGETSVDELARILK
ncbi:MAG: hypothetical protein DWQ31_00910 [Planctomycetota bacterium]|nr:MAG: hypothetical protein DWQ31_00910 [Planctomycetota bacterium]